MEDKTHMENETARLERIKSTISLLRAMLNFESAAELLKENFIAPHLTRDQLMSLPDLQEKLTVMLKEGNLDPYTLAESIVDLVKRDIIKSKSKAE